MKPQTRPLGDNFPAVQLETQEGGSTSSFVDQSTNKHLPYIWFNGVLGALALGLSIGAIIITLVIHSRATVAENHWRNDEVDIRSLQTDVKKLQQENGDARP